MAGYTREIYTVNANGRRGSQIGYARFSPSGQYLGSFGGYDKNGNRNGAGSSNKVGRSAMANTAMMNIVTRSRDNMFFRSNRLEPTSRERRQRNRR